MAATATEGERERWGNGILLWLLWHFLVDKFNLHKLVPRSRKNAIENARALAGHKAQDKSSALKQKAN